MCTMYPFGARFFAKIRLSIRRFTYVRSGPKRNSNCVQLMQFYGVGALLATIINKRFYYFKMKAVYVTNEDVEGPSTISTRWISGLLFFIRRDALLRCSRNGIISESSPLETRYLFVLSKLLFWTFRYFLI